MLTRLRRTHPHRAAQGRANPYYGYGYRPDWPSILAVACDAADGGRVLVYTDRPCALLGAATGLPFSVGPAGARAILAAEALAPTTFRVRFNGPIAAGAAWAWGAPAAGFGSGNLVDPVTNNPLNPSAGDCADAPGPYVPPTPAAVVAAQPDGSQCTLEFDRDVVLVFPPQAPDDAILFDGTAAESVQNLSATVLQFSLSTSVSPGSTWAIQRQPAWVATALAAPAGGDF